MGKRPKGLLEISEVSKQSSRSGKLGPVLTSFHHAALDTSCLSSSPSTSLSLVSWQQDVPRLEVTVDSGSVSYHSQKQENTSGMTTYLGIRDKVTGKTRLIETNSVVLRADVTYPPTTNPTLLAEGPGKDITYVQRMEASKHLIKSFGQQKGSRFYEQQERMRIESSQADMRASKAAMGADLDVTAEVTGAPINKESLLPMRNLDATSPEDVYKVEEILTERERTALSEAAGQMLESHDTLEKLKEEQKNRQLSGMGVALLDKALKATHKDLGHVGLLLFFEGCVRFSRLRAPDLRKGVRALQPFLPIFVRQKILDLFSELSGSDRVVSPELADKAKCYIIVLALLLQGLSVEVSQLTEALFVRPDHLRKLVSVVGARMEGDSNGQGQKIMLRLPLASFTMEMMRSRKKK